MYDSKDILTRHEEMMALRRSEEPAWRDIARIIRPDDQDFSSTDSANPPDGADVYDSAPLHAHSNFVGGMFGESVNPAERWMEFTIGDKDLAKWGPVRDWLWNEASRMYASFSPAVSSFYPEATSWFADGGAFGNGFIYQEEWAGKQRLIDQAIPLGQCCIDVDADGTHNALSREFFLSGRQKKSRFGDYAGQCEESRRYKIVHLVQPNPDYRPGMLGPRGMAFTSSYCSPDDRDFKVDGGYYELPYHALFWSKQAGRTWARGPGHIARPDMNMNNEMERSNLVGAQFAAEPLILVRDEKISASQIHPNAILRGQMSEQGKPLFQYADRGDNPGIAENKTQQRKDAIREAFLFSLLQVINRPQMTATEFLGWKEEKFRLLGPHLVRVHQALAGLVARRWRILARAGQTLPPPPELRGQNIAIEFVSPLAKAQQAATGRALMQWIGALGTIAELSNDPAVFDKVNKDNAADVLHAVTVGLPGVINDARTVAAIRQQRAEGIEKSLAVEHAAQLASVYADVAHANQAQTRAGQRSQKPN